jgi:hypothetical protein
MTVDTIIGSNHASVFDVGPLPIAYDDGLNPDEAHRIVQQARQRALIAVGVSMGEEAGIPSSNRRPDHIKRVAYIPATANGRRHTDLTKSGSGVVNGQAR